MTEDNISTNHHHGHETTQTNSKQRLLINSSIAMYRGIRSLLGKDKKCLALWNSSVDGAYFFTTQVYNKNSLLVGKIRNNHLKWFQRSPSTFKACLHDWIRVCYSFSQTLYIQTLYIVHWKMVRKTVSDIVDPFSYSNMFKM